MSTITYVLELPDCDYCGPGGSPAVYDAKTQLGPWAYMCADHWERYGPGVVGTGYGQHLVLEADRYPCPNPSHTNCHGPTGVHVPAKCEVCWNACHTNTCWQACQRVPSTTPVLCAACSTQGVLL